MTKEKTNLDKRFRAAVEKAARTDLDFPPDVKLYFYAYYKRATGFHSEHREHEDIEGSTLINAFKMNALFQAKDVSPDEAKERYIELVDKYIPKNN